MFRKIIYIALIILLISLTACEDKSSLSAPKDPSTGDADFTKFMSIGNSLTAGYQSGALFEGAQQYSMGNLIAKQVNTTYVQPKYANPGYGNRKELKDFAPTIQDNPMMGQLLNEDYQYSYNNMGIPGALLTDILLATDSLTCMSYEAGGTANPYFSHVLRGKGTVLEQVMNSHPTFVTIWVGNNDVLGYATSGGTTYTGALGAKLLQESLFELQYNTMIDSILIANTKGVLATLPNVLDIPFFTTIGPKIAQGLSAMGIDSSLPVFYYQKNDVNVVTSQASINDLLSKKIALTLYGASAAALVGDTTGAYYNGNAPSWVVTSAPFGLHPQNPWPDALVLDEDEIELIETHTDLYNNIINNSAAAYQDTLVVADMNAFISDIVENHYTEYGIDLNGDFITGGLFSLDGIHPTSRGYAVLANKFIEVINAEFNAEIPLINVSTIEGSIILAD